MLAFIFVLLFLAIGIAYGALSWGFVCWKFWYWFLLPVFPALPHIVFLQAVALMMFVSILKTQPSQYIKPEYTNQTIANIGLLIAPWLILLLGWIVKIFVLKSM